MVFHRELWVINGTCFCMKKIKTDLRCLTLVLSDSVHGLNQLSQSHS